LMKGLQRIVNSNIELIIGAGRTDAGVHAINYFAHFKYSKLDVIDLTYRMNRFLPLDIVIHRINLIDSSFHARYSAIARKYEYWISAKKDPFLINRAYFFSRPLDLDLMNAASKMLVGKKNFSSFSKSQTHNNICDVKSAYWFQTKNMLIFSIEADRFLYNMVRCIVGTLISLGLKQINLDQFLQIIDSFDRSNAGYSVPACGLYLLDIKYPKSFSIESI